MVTGGPFTGAVIIDGSNAFSGCSDFSQDPSARAAQIDANPENVESYVARAFSGVTAIVVTSPASNTVQVTFTLAGTSLSAVTTQINTISQEFGATAVVTSEGTNSYKVVLTMNGSVSEAATASSFLLALLLCVCSWFPS